MEVLESGGIDALLVFVYDVGVVRRVFVFAQSGLVMLRRNNMAANQSHKSDKKEKLFHLLFPRVYLAEIKALVCV